MLSRRLVRDAKRSNATMFLYDSITTAIVMELAVSLAQPIGQPYAEKSLVCFLTVVAMFGRLLRLLP